MNHTYRQSLHTQDPKMPVLALFSESKKDHPFLRTLDQQDRTYVLTLLKDFKGGWLDIDRISLPSNPKARVILFGLGEKKRWNHRRMYLAIRKITGALKGMRQVAFSLLLDDFRYRGNGLDVIAEISAREAELAAYEFTQYRKKPKEETPSLADVYYYAKIPGRGSSVQKGLDRGRIIGEQVNRSRELSNTPGSDMTPTALASAAREDGKRYGFKVKTLGEEEMKKLSMGAILGVSKGSTEEAQLIVMEYHNGSRNKKPIVFVGKGITFDTGGINLKPTGALDEMHMDMSGGAAVIAAVGALARLKTRVNVIGIVPAVENMPSGSSYRPGDILRSMSGVTIEVVNTDAEGRVVLSDALTYAERYQPSLVVDVATLTGACMVALAPYAAGVFSRDAGLISSLQAYGENAGDYLWPLPLWEEYEEDVKGKICDVRNAKNNRNAGATNGALFLSTFAEKFPRWAHLDIASTMTTTPDMFLAGGSRGSGTALLIEIARHS